MEHSHCSSKQVSPTGSVHSSTMVQSEDIAGTVETIGPGENENFLTSHHSAPQTPSMQSSIGRGLWVWEIFGAGLSLSCIISLLIVLPCLDQSSLAKWQFVMAPNTTISTFITIAKTSMLLAVAAGISQLKWVHFTTTKRQISDLDIFDEASRGPWGAIKFIFHMKGRSVLTSIGAFVVVASLAMEPFAQQILSFETIPVASPGGSAHASIAHAYYQPVSRGEEFSYISQEFQAAFMMGILRSPFQWPFQCSTGNCSWPAFSTLGMCASCTNVTSSSQKRVVIDRAVNASNGEWGTDHQTIYYTTPTGLELEVHAGGRIYSDSGIGSGGPRSLVTSTAVESQPWDVRLRDPVIAVAAISTSFKLSVTSKVDNFWGGDKYDFAPPDITECYISWCMKQYKSFEVVSGAIVLPSMETVEIPSHDVPNDRDYCNNGDFYYQLPTTPNKNGNESTNFTVSCSDHVAISSFLVESLNFTVYPGESTFDNGASTYIGPMLFSRPNVTGLFEDITKSLTHHIQTGPNSTVHNGTSSISEIYVIVRWPWVILPAVVVIIGAVFLAVIIFVNYRSDVRLWKASLEPLLFHGLDGWKLDEIDVDIVGGMEKLAKETKAQLARNEEGRLKLIRC